MSSSAENSACFKVQNDGRFQAAVSKSKRIISEPQSQGSSTPKINGVRSNLHQALQNRKQSIFNLNISSGLGRSPKGMLLCQPDYIKEGKESEESSNSSDDSENKEEKQEKNGLTVSDFNDNMIENITNLYHQLQRELELNENDQTIQKAYFQIEPLYWQFNQQRLYDFEVMTSYDCFFKNDNFNEIIKHSHNNNSNWQLLFLENYKNICFIHLFLFKNTSIKRNVINPQKQNMTLPRD